MRQFELDLMRVLALFLLFAFHSYLSVLYPGMWFVETYLLSAFFLVSGYLFAKSLASKPPKDVIKSRLGRIYVPFLLALLLYFVLSQIVALFFSPAQLSAWGLYDMIRGFLQPLSYVFHATGLSIFYVLSSGNFGLYHLWFIVHLFAYFFLFLGISRLSGNKKSAAAIAVFIFLMALWSSELIFRLEWKFEFFFLVFYCGFWLAQNSRLEKFYGMTWQIPCLVLLAAAATIDTPTFGVSSPFLKDFLGNMAFTLTRDAFAISSVLVTLWAFHRIKPGDRLQAFTKSVSGSSIQAYLLQPVVSSLVVSILIVLNGGPIGLGVIIIGVVLSFALGIFIAGVVQKDLEKLTTAVSKRS